jgi:hypothetical protein
MKFRSTKGCTFQAPKTCHGQSDHNSGLLAIESLKESDLSCTQMMGWFPNSAWIWPHQEELSQPATLILWKLNTRVMFFRSRSPSSKFVGLLSNLWLAGYAKIVSNYIYTPGFEGAAVAGAFEIIYMIFICPCPLDVREREVNDGYLLELWSRCSPLPFLPKSFYLSVIDDDEWLLSCRDSDAQEVQKSWEWIHWTHVGGKFF